MALVTPNGERAEDSPIPNLNSPDTHHPSRKEARRVNRCRRVARRFERYGMPSRIPAVTEYIEYPIIKLRALRNYGELNDLRQAWWRGIESRLIVGCNLSTAAALVLLVGMLISGKNSFAGYACIAALNVLTFGCLSAMFSIYRFGIRIERDPEGFIARHHPELLCSARVVNQLWTKAEWAKFSSDDGYRAVAGLCAAGGVSKFPAEWLSESHTPSSDERALLELFGSTEWIESQGLGKDEREVYDRLIGEFYGTLGELLETSRRLC